MDNTLGEGCCPFSLGVFLMTNPGLKETATKDSSPEISSRSFTSALIVTEKRLLTTALSGTEGHILLSKNKIRANSGQRPATLNQEPRKPEV